MLGKRGREIVIDMEFVQSTTTMSTATTSTTTTTTTVVDPSDTILDRERGPKLSTVIEALIEQKERHGDLPVTFYCTHCSSRTSDVPWTMSRDGLHHRVVFD